MLVDRTIQEPTLLHRMPTSSRELSVLFLEDTGRAWQALWGVVMDQVW